MFGYENGTSGIKNFAIKDFIEKEPVLIPKEQDIVEFQKIIDNLQKQKQIKGTENTTLSLLRDTLLPSLNVRRDRSPAIRRATKENNEKENIKY